MKYRKLTYKKLRGIGAIIAIIALGGWLFLKNPAKEGALQRSSDFVVGTTSGYAPFVSINERGEYEGFDIDVAKALAEKMGKKLVIKDLGSMTALFMALDQGSIDAIIWGLSITQDRLKKIAMVRYQGDDTMSYPLIFWGPIPAGISSINDMKGMTVCVEPTSSQDVVLAKYPSINRMFTEKVDDALLNIQYGKAQAALVDPLIARKFKKKYPQISVLEVPLAPEDQVKGVGAALKTSNSPMITSIKKAVADLQRAGTLKALEEKWDLV